MPFVRVGREDSAEIAIQFGHQGVGWPIVLVHGHPLDGDSSGAAAST